MPTERRVSPHYAEKFECIGSACEDTCCRNWTIPIDEATYKKYGDLPHGPLRKLIFENIQIFPEPAAPVGAPKPLFAKIQLDGDHQCPMLSQDRLCRIQTECGADYLPNTCAAYPRIVHAIDGVKESALTLACPEAARLVLLNKNLLDSDLQRSAAADPAPLKSARPNPASANPDARAPVRAWFWPIRASVIAVIRNRSYPLWQRMFLLGIFCRDLDSMAADTLRNVPRYLADFDAEVTSGRLRAGMDALPTDGDAQLDVVLRLAGLLLHRSHVSPRFVQCVNAFTNGIGNGPGATLASLTAQYSLAYSRYYAPFFSRHPHILENYLINTIFRCQFPFGREGAHPDDVPALAYEFALLVGQFTLMKGLLIGAAGFHGDRFTQEHVIETVQPAARHFEHHPEFLKAVHALLVESRMDGPRGVSILMRNDAAKPSRTAPQHLPVGLI